MLDLKYIRENKELVNEGLIKKGSIIDLNQLLLLDEKRRSVLTEVEKLKALLNSVNKEIGLLKKNNKSFEDKIYEMKDVSKKIKELDLLSHELDGKVNAILITIPNIPHSSVPVGGEKDFEIVRENLIDKDYAFKPKPHWELAESLDIVDFKRGAKISGSGFLVYKGDGARLERALINYFLDTHINNHGFKEVSTPFLVNRESMFGTGQLPKMEDDMYHLGDEDLFLIPTAEVPVTNLFSKEIMDISMLPLKYVAYSPCFRREAGSYGKDTRGMVRVHQFDKVEMVLWSKPEDSYKALEELTTYAENLLKALKLPYRILNLASKDISFASAKTYDLEVFSYGMERYLEVSSISNFEDFQARRARIRFRKSQGEKSIFLHTLNGSGLALPRIFIAILENYQNSDGSITIPEVLIPYMAGKTKIG